MTRFRRTGLGKRPTGPDHRTNRTKCLRASPRGFCDRSAPPVSRGLTPWSELIEHVCENKKVFTPRREPDPVPRTAPAGAPPYAPPGWPAGVRAPGVPGWEETAVSWLLDV